MQKRKVLKQFDRNYGLLKGWMDQTLYVLNDSAVYVRSQWVPAFINDRTTV